MERNNLEKYYSSMLIISKMLSNGLISEEEYLKAEEFLAQKHCIKKGNLYRRNDLIMPPERVIYSDAKEEVK